MKKYFIIGSGRQGTAAAYDIIKFASPESLTIIDASIENLNKCKNLIKKLTGCDINATELDINDAPALIKILEDGDIFLSSVPYPFNPYLTDIAIETSTSMVDLGGHTQSVIKQLEKSSDAAEKSISIVPDCGMGPGMNVSMALLAMESLDTVKDVYIWDGGLPIDPKPPWNYNLFFNIEGLTNEYDGNAFFIRNGKIIEVECFKDLEMLDFGDGIGKLEAVVTSGGLSTMPWTYDGKIKTLENKTLRYKGHWKEMIAFRQLGLFSETPIEFKGNNIVPREFYHHLLEPVLDGGRVEDICIMRTQAHGTLGSAQRTITAQCIERYDKVLDISAMEKCTGWHASMVMGHIMDGNVQPGAISIEKAMTGKEFFNYAKLRGYSIEISDKA